MLCSSGSFLTLQLHTTSSLKEADTTEFSQSKGLNLRNLPIIKESEDENSGLHSLTNFLFDLGQTIPFLWAYKEDLEVLDPSSQ